MEEVSCVLDAKALLGEGPLWDAADRALHWVDIKRREIHRFDPATGRDEKWSTPEDVGSLALRERGGLVVALTSGFHFFDPATGEIVPIAKPELDRATNRFNDGKPDRQGRFWAGSMDDREAAPTGALYRLDADLSCTRLVDGVVCSNALCWSPDSRTLYYADSGRRIVWAWDFDAADGTIDNRRVFIELPKGEGVPDGATVDAEGFVWLAQWNGWRVTRYDAKGRVDRVVRLPVQCPTCPMFGGSKLDVLYVTSASNKLTPEQRQAQPLAGGIFAIDPRVRGLPEARFKG